MENQRILKRTILFVCRGNIHRSVIAEICLSQELKKLGLQEQFRVISRGIQGCCGTKIPKHKNLTYYETEWSLTRPILEKLGIDLSEIPKHIATSVSEDDVRRADVVYAMELTVLGRSSNALPNSLLVQFPKYSPKMHFFGEIEDRSEDLSDCGESDDPNLHLLVNERIVHTIRESLQRIIRTD